VQVQADPVVLPLVGASGDLPDAGHPGLHAHPEHGPPHAVRTAGGVFHHPSYREDVEQLRHSSRLVFQDTAIPGDRWGRLTCRSSGLSGADVPMPVASPTNERNFIMPKGCAVLIHAAPAEFSEPRSSSLSTKRPWAAARNSTRHHWKRLQRAENALHTSFTGNVTRDPRRGA
jgi:hypothetical protein